MNLGFTYNEAKEALYAFKDENMAANYLFEKKSNQYQSESSTNKRKKNASTMTGSKISK